MRQNKALQTKQACDEAGQLGEPEVHYDVSIVCPAPDSHTWDDLTLFKRLQKIGLLNVKCVVVVLVLFAHPEAKS